MIPPMPAPIIAIEIFGEGEVIVVESGMNCMKVTEGEFMDASILKRVGYGLVMHVSFLLGCRTPCV
jgi:regulator of RNase E activity RraA